MRASGKGGGWGVVEPVWGSGGIRGLKGLLREHERGQNGAGAAKARRELHAASSRSWPSHIQGLLG